MPNRTEYKIQELLSRNYGGYLPKAQYGYNNTPQYATQEYGELGEGFTTNDTMNEQITAGASAVPVYGQFAQYGKIAQDAVTGPNIQDELTGADTGIREKSGAYGFAENFTPHKEFLRSVKDIKNEGLGTKQGRMSALNLGLLVNSSLFSSVASLAISNSPS